MTFVHEVTVLCENNAYETTNTQENEENGDEELETARKQMLDFFRRVLARVSVLKNLENTDLQVAFRAELKHALVECCREKSPELLEELFQPLQPLHQPQ